SQAMEIEGPLDSILAGVLPHEVTHAVLAHAAGGPLPRWADEGAALLSEDKEEQRRHERSLRQILNSGRAMPLRRLFELRDYPKDVMVLFTQGYSVTRFLVEQQDHPTFLKFVRAGAREGWNKAVQRYYRYANVEELEQAWLAQVRRDRREA